MSFGDQIEFVSDEAISKRIKYLMAESGESYAVVAFIGEAASKFLPRKETKVLCNFDSLGTNPFGVEKLPAFDTDPTLTNVWGLKNLHAKVYWSTRGAIVTSANASTNGLEVIGESGNRNKEAGIYVPATNNALHRQIKTWCEEQFKSAKLITQAMVDEKKLAWKQVSQSGKPSKFSSTHALEPILRNPERFCLLYVFGSTDIPDTTKVKTRSGNRPLKELEKEGWEWMEEPDLAEMPLRKSKEKLSNYFRYGDGSRHIISVRARVGKNGAISVYKEKPEFLNFIQGATIALRNDQRYVNLFKFSAPSVFGVPDVAMSAELGKFLQSDLVKKTLKKNNAQNGILILRGYESTSLSSIIVKGEEVAKFLKDPIP